MTKTRVRKNNRLTGYDYSNNAAYFVTICARNREYIFGEIQNIKYNYVGVGLAPTRNIAPARIKLTEIGKIIDKNWRGIPNQYENVCIDKYIIMPNHIHGILIVNKS